MDRQHDVLIAEEAEESHGWQGNTTDVRKRGFLSVVLLRYRTSSKTDKSHESRQRISISPLPLSVTGSQTVRA